MVRGQLRGQYFCVSTIFAERSIPRFVKERCLILRCLGKPLIHFFFVGEEFLDARALLHALKFAAVIASPQTLLNPQAQFTIDFGE
jgi:hypothetical protein